MSIPDFAETIIILDTEYTAWEGSQERKWSGENEHREIVQIGAIKVDANTLTEIDSFNHFVKPTLNPELSEYFTNLTGISQKQIDELGIEYPVALSEYFSWAENFDTYSFGKGDEKVLRENCELKGIPFLPKGKFFNMRDTFRKYGIPVENYNSGNIVEAFGIKKERSAHNALNDVRTILDGLRLLELKLERMSDKNHEGRGLPFKLK